MKILSVIKYEGNNDVFVWKHPNEDFSTASQLIVHESQEAVFFKNGEALDVFEAGRHTLKTQNIPLIRKFVNLPFDGESPFHCEVYFINKTHSMDILWGTSNPIPIQDAVYGIILPIGANGQFAVQIEDSKKFLVKMVGTVKKFDQQSLITAFRGILMTKIKDCIAKLFVKDKITFLEVHSHLDSISQAIKEDLSEEFIEYGIKLINFNVNAIVVPENDPSYVQLKLALAKKAEMNVVGYNYGQERTYDVLDKAASNEGAGSQMMGAGMGLGMGVNLGSVLGTAMGGAFTNIDSKVLSTNEEKIRCKKCNAQLPKDAKFCLSCGEKVVSEEMVICKNCGQETKKGNFCLHCGNKLSNNCSKCGAELQPNAKFCFECGQKVGE
ncbi:SPFH domain-containing protein [Sedimentibacter sp. zth1]|uniref:SPFH domain-containing protein n=1 Tax=Sedimentibacter sp. zth1 TaxID=2816908 RepID=UPI001A91A666|nr:SPFH domain-containing protein [Sedimentibacter sp. zth1]QSX05084.1 SPFH domain-containing protein [Sedimentibacter sp. zth1]